MIFIIYFFMKKVVKITIAAAAPAAALLIYIFKDLILSLSKYLPECWILKLTGFYCPGCGNTRSVRALLRGDIIASLRSNIAIPLILVLLFLLYIEFLFDICGKKVRLLPRKLSFWMVLLFVMFVYYAVRNFCIGLAPV